MRRLPKTIRLDGSDLQAFDRVAEPGEWALPGGFTFSDIEDPMRLTRKRRLAFGTGWLGLDSFGFSTFVEVAEIAEEDYEALAGRVADTLVREFGAPTRAAALRAAREELEYASGLCGHKVHTLLAVEREMTDTGIREAFRSIAPPRARDHARIWEIVPDTDS